MGRHTGQPIQKTDNQMVPVGAALTCPLKFPVSGPVRRSLKGECGCTAHPFLNNTVYWTGQVAVPTKNE